MTYTFNDMILTSNTKSIYKSNELTDRTTIESIFFNELNISLIV